MIETLNSLTNIELGLIGIIFTLFFFHLFYPWISYRKLLFFKVNKHTKNEDSPLPPISVIICAKDEARNLRKFLPQVLEQNYTNYQVVVVDDCSTDGTDDLLVNLKEQYAHLYTTRIKPDPIYRHGKKLAVMLGIKAAKYEHLVFTDADCCPTSKEWLSEMASNFSSSKDIVLGISPYLPSKGLLGQIIGYETLQTAIDYVSSAMRGKTYMGVGRNMAYTKKLFYDNNGFSGHTHILSGDDDLFINKVASSTNVEVQLSSESHMLSIPETTWKSWFKQKRRHMSTGRYYKASHKRRFALEAMLNTLFIVMVVLLIVLNIFPVIVASLLLLKHLNNAIIRYICVKKLNMNKSYFFASLWLNILVPFFRTYLLFLTFVKPQKVTWR